MGLIKSLPTLREEEEQWAVYYSSPQSFMIMLLSVVLKTMGTSAHFDWLVN